MDRSASARLAVVMSIILVAGCGGGLDAPAPSALSPASATASPSPAPTATAAPTSASPSTANLPAFEPDEPLVLFTRVTDAGGGVFVLRPDGSGLAQLGTDVLPGVHKRGDWSPDGQRVVFIDETSGRMWIASLDGSPTVSVPTCDAPGCDFPSWSPDGTRIVFSRCESADGVIGPQACGIHIVDVATNEVSPVVRLERPLLADIPRWSPDGSHIAFGVDRMDHEAFDTGAAIGVVPAAGGEPRIITAFEQFAYNGDWGWQSDEIVYSPAFGLQREVAADQQTLDLFGVRSDGTGQRQITRVQPGQQLVSPRWTPDGRAIIAWDLTAGGPVLVDPTTGEIQDFGVAGVEARPILRPVP